MDTKIAYHRPNTTASLFEISDILQNGYVVNGLYVRQLEQHFVDTCRVKYAVACASCTSGLIATVEAVQRLYGIETIGLPVFTWYSTWYAVQKNDVVGVLWEIDKDSWIMKMTEEGIKDVDAAMFVDTFGSMAPTLNTDKPVIYDAAHGYGLSKLGQRGIAEVVSFSYTKIVTAMQGGVILTNNKEVYEIVKDLVTKYFKMEEINALVCLNSIYQYKDTQLARRSIINHYLSEIKHNITLQKTVETNDSVFGVLFENTEIRDRVAHNLDKNGIGYKIYYVPVFKAPIFKTTYDIYNRILCLPVYPELTIEQVQFICDKINSVK